MLRNRLGLRDPDELAEYEAISFAQRATSPLPPGRFGVTHYCAVHRHLFGDVYRWAGRYRRVRISKGGNAFCYPEYISQEMRRLFGRLAATRLLRGLDRLAFAAGAATFLAELNAIHPFREGNGRAQVTFLAALAAGASHPLHLAALDEARFLDAMIRSFHGDEDDLRAQLVALTEA